MTRSTPKSKKMPKPFKASQNPEKVVFLEISKRNKVPKRGVPTKTRWLLRMEKSMIILHAESQSR
jgi:hypothetical protein